MRVINILEEQEQCWIPILLDKIATMQQIPHENNANYLNFEKRLVKYECFTIVVNDDDEIMAMCGLYPFGNGLFRVMDRTLYFNWHREVALNSFKYRNTQNRNYASHHMLPYQIEYAKRIDASAVFVSVQTPKKRRAFAKIISDGNYPGFTLLENLYNTTPSDGPTCWQSVALYKFKEYAFHLPMTTIAAYNERFHDK